LQRAVVINTNTFLQAWPSQEPQGAAKTTKAKCTFTAETSRGLWSFSSEGTLCLSN